MSRQNRIESIKNLLLSEPNDAFLQYALATEFVANNQDREAKEIFTKLLIQSPDYEPTYYHLGKLYQRLAQNDEAIETFEKGIELSRKLKNGKNVAELQNALNELLDY